MMMMTRALWTVNLCLCTMLVSFILLSDFKDSFYYTDHLVVINNDQALISFYIESDSPQLSFICKNQFYLTRRSVCSGNTSS
jgi:hypothetical protein